MRRLPLPALACALLLAGCGTIQPSALPSVPVSLSPSASPVEPSPSMSSSASPSMTPTSTASTALHVTLGAKAVGPYAFGTAEDTVAGFLNAQVGKPTDSFSGPVCEFDSATPYGRQLQYEDTFLFFQSAPKKGKSAPRKLTGWVVRVDQPQTKFQLASPLPLKTTYADLKTAFPKGTFEEVALGEGSFWVFTTPSGVWYRGEDKSAPSEVGAGPQQTCE